MKNQKQLKIYYRPTHEWIEVTPEEKKWWERYINSYRIGMQRNGTCCVPRRKSYLCDQNCEECVFRRKPKDIPYDYSIDEEMQRILDGESSFSGFLSDKALTTEINVDHMHLREVMAELKNSDPEGHEILTLFAEGYSARECARRLNLKKSTYTYKRDKLIKALREKF